MSALTLGQALERQSQVSRHLAALVKLGEMQQTLSNPYTWEAVLECKQREIDALEGLGFPALQAACGPLLGTRQDPGQRRLAGLMAENHALLQRICALEQQAERRMATLVEGYRRQLNANRTARRVHETYAAPRPGARFLSHTR